MAKAASTASTAPVPGSLFGVPGGTLPIEENDTTVNLFTQQSSSSQQPVNGILPFKQTDVVLGWEAWFNYNATVTAGAGQTVTVSPWWPYTILGALKLSFQNQYDVINVLSARDLAFFLSYRSRWYVNDSRNANYAAPVGEVASNGFPLSTWSQPLAGGLVSSSLMSGPNITPTGAQNKDFFLRIPASITLDRYYPMDVNGNVLGRPGKAILSPQYMGGTTRIITPSLTLSPAFGTADTSPYYTTTTTSATSDAPSTLTANTLTNPGVTLTMRRYGYYSSRDVRVMPPVQPWQYALKSFQFPLSNASGQINIPLPNDDGQVLSLWVFLFDPTLIPNGGGVSMANIQYARVLYGSSLKRFDDTPVTAQYRWQQQHDQLPPAGFIGWDLALAEDGKLENSGSCLNTLSTNAITIQLNTISTYTFSSGAYASVGRELLNYVVPQ